jgi:23S rRNA (pseudouridine1915-N3)-methyltransferase
VKIVILAVGKMRDRNMAALCDDYLARTRRHVPVEAIEVDDDAALLRRIPASGAVVVALEPGGESWDTAQLTAFIGKQMLHGTRSLVFLIGGSDGLARAAVARAGCRLSLSRLTLPHRLARVLLCEQIYRALSILRDEPYSR